MRAVPGTNTPATLPQIHNSAGLSSIWLNDSGVSLLHIPKLHGNLLSVHTLKRTNPQASECGT